ncbi:amidase [Cordyceps militaris CM01]|uniref:Amidase n=1 Tax=Cordyceps militaris (strain CM01) TaxID=983644 RepID=G3JNH4_CORMM|nr:amidase [Cordyceps militaris CM01]EGX89814.1 amidase [Cordyceps militaris CM01]
MVLVNFLDGAGFDANSHTLALVYATTPGEIISVSSLREFRANTLSQDDVFQPDFATNLIFYGSDETDLAIEPDALEELKAWNVRRHCVLESNQSHSPYLAAPGPQDLATVENLPRFQCLFYGRAQAFSHKLFEISDRSASHAIASIIHTKLTSLTLIAVDAPYAGVNGRIVVPSRCYYKPTKDRPLAGARISVKDNIDVAGHKTTLCNRAWTDLYPAKTKNAACIQTLIDAGAVIVGKVKLQAMIMREEPLECVEFTAPFNPRADGYQVPSGSSHASAASIASYEWLDFSVGSDKLWKRDCPDGEIHGDIAKYLETAGIYPFYHDQYYSLESFRNEYAQKFGRPAFVQRALHWQWEVGKAVTKEERNECWRRSEVYRHWMLDKVFKADSPETVVIMALPIEAGQPNYRDAPLPPYSLLSGYAALNMSPMLRAPEVTAPVGDIPYMSTVTYKEESLPVKGDPS